MNAFHHYIGMPWVAGAEGPQAWDCFSFTRHVQEKHFHCALPRLVFPDYDAKRQLVELYSATRGSIPWDTVLVPRHGDMVVIRSPLHTGTWLDIDGGGTLHCVRGQGVVWTRDTAWMLSGFGPREYLRFRGVQ